MLKKVISLLVLIMYLHGLSGYTMNFHKCSITGFEKVYTSYNTEDPCHDEDDECTETIPHYEQADCCDLQQTSVSIDDDGNINYYKINLQQTAILFTLFQDGYSAFSKQVFNAGLTLDSNSKTGPPELSDICVFRI